MATDFRKTETMQGLMSVALKEAFPLMTTTNQTLEQNLKVGTKTVKVRVRAKSSLQEYTGADLTFNKPTVTTEEMTLTQKKAIAENILDIDIQDDAEADRELQKIVRDAALDVRKNINTLICGHYSDVQAGNIIIPDSDPVVITKKNVFTWLNSIAQKMDEDEIPEELRYIVVPPAISTMITNFKNENEGYEGSVEAKLVKCNQVYKTGTGANTVFRILGYHRDFIASALAISNTNVGKIERVNFGMYANGLFLYDTKVFDATKHLGYLMCVKVSNE